MPSTAGLPKSERLCSERRIDALFQSGMRGYVHPLKYVWLTADSGDGEPPVTVLFSVPKKIFKRAWKRNLIKRRMKESYRQRKQPLFDKLTTCSRRIILALICTAGEIPDQKTIDHAVARILEQIEARS